MGKRSRCPCEIGRLMWLEWSEQGRVVGEESKKEVGGRDHGGFCKLQQVYEKQHVAMETN